MKESIDKVIRLRQHIDSLLQRDSEKRLIANQKVSNEILERLKDGQEEQSETDKRKGDEEDYRMVVTA